MEKQENYFMQTDRLGFSKWTQNDVDLAKLLWGDPKVTWLICASGIFSQEEIIARLAKEIENDEKYHIQYWPIFKIISGEFIGCCGIRPYIENVYEIGFHLRPAFWGQGYAKEAAKAVRDYSFSILHAEKLFAGHNPQNMASRKLLVSLGFSYIGDIFYEPTGLYHPSYELRQ